MAELDQRLSAANLPPLVEAHLPRLLNRTWLPQMEQRVGEIRAAILLRIATEELTVARDVRTVAWLRDPVAQADAARRLFEDALFTNAGDLHELQTDAESLFDRASQRSAAVSQAYRLRDSVLAALPAYAFWFTRPQPYAAPAEEQAKAISIALYELVHDTRRLGAALATTYPSEGDFLEVQRLTTVCEDNVRKLREQFDADCETLVWAANNSSASGDVASSSGEAGPDAGEQRSADSMEDERTTADLRRHAGSAHGRLAHPGTTHANAATGERGS